jgi:hypothetical protein
MQDTYADTTQDEAHFRSMQVGRYTHAYSITLRVPNDRSLVQAFVSGTSLLRSAVLQIEEDAEFHITHMSAAVMAPVGDASEVRDPTLVPVLPMAGVDTGRSDRGLAFRITETGSGRRLTRGHSTMIGPNVMAPTANSQNWWWAQQGFLALESVFPPAYGFEFAAPVAFEYHLERNKRLLVEFINRDSDIQGNDPPYFAGFGGHRVTFCFLGQRYDT